MKGDHSCLENEESLELTEKKSEMKRRAENTSDSLRQIFDESLSSSSQSVAANIGFPSIVGSLANVPFLKIRSKYCFRIYDPSTISRNTIEVPFLRIRCKYIYSKYD